MLCVCWLKKQLFAIITQKGYDKWIFSSAFPSMVVLLMLVVYTRLLSDPRLFFFDDLSSFSRFDGRLTFSFVFIHHTDFNWDSCQGLMQPTHVKWTHVHFGFLEVVFHQEWRMFWIAVVLEDKEMTQTQFFNWLVEVFFESLHISFFLYDSFRLDEISSSTHTEVSPKE